MENEFVKLGERVWLGCPTGDVKIVKIQAAIASPRMAAARRQVANASVYANRCNPVPLPDHLYTLTTDALTTAEACVSKVVTARLYVSTSLFYFYVQRIVQGVGKISNSLFSMTRDSTYSYASSRSCKVANFSKFSTFVEVTQFSRLSTLEVMKFSKFSTFKVASFF